MEGHESIEFHRLLAQAPDELTPLAGASAAELGQCLFEAGGMLPMAVVVELIGVGDKRVFGREGGEDTKVLVGLVRIKHVFESDELVPECESAVLIVAVE